MKAGPGSCGLRIHAELHLISCVPIAFGKYSVHLTRGMLKISRRQTITRTIPRITAILTLILPHIRMPHRVAYLFLTILVSYQHHPIIPMPLHLVLAINQLRLVVVLALVASHHHHQQHTSSPDHPLHRLLPPPHLPHPLLHTRLHHGRLAWEPVQLNLAPMWEVRYS